MDATTTLASRVIVAFLEPALAATDWREKWKGVNRAAGVVAGWAMACPLQLDACPSCGYMASSYGKPHYRITSPCPNCGVLAIPPIAATAESIVGTVESLFHGDPARVQLTDGLRKRVVEILVLMEG